MLEAISLAKFKPQSFEIKEIGTVIEVKKAVVSVVGLPTCLFGQMVNFPNDMVGMVVGYDEKKVSVLVFGDVINIKAGDQVVGKAEPFELPVGNGFVGRVVNSMSVPLDGKGKIEADEGYPVFRVAPGVMERTPLSDALYSGTKIFDAVLPLGKGQRQLIVGDRMTGKTVIGIDAILNQKGKNIVCLYCCVGRSHASLSNIIHLLTQRGAMDYTLVIAATAASSVGEQFLAPFSACALGEYFMYHGRDVLVVFDDLTKHAWVHREISLLLERSPGREAYPGDVFYIHSQMMERAGRLNEERGGGTMTFLPIVETQQGDVTGHIPSNLISITDGQLYINANIFIEGFKPAIDFGLSVSRIGSKVQCKAMKELGGKLRLEYLQYKMQQKLTNVNAILTEEAEARMKRGEALTQIFMQDKNAPVSLEEQIVLFYGINSAVLQKMDKSGWKTFKDEIFSFLLKTRPALIQEIGTKQEMTPQIKDQLDKSFGEFLSLQIPEEEKS
ncbi:MAG: F0F1 ATP synthase subunit alpha [Deltaproteobacteria bacterium]|nr:F0F1 ATP synthase subunit alpha [Deltaproteobacteria bacterium]